MPDLVDHISDDGYTTLCGLREDQLPPAPLCPHCLAVERKTGQPGVMEMKATRMASRPEPAVPR